MAVIGESLSPLTINVPETTTNGLPAVLSSSIRPRLTEHLTPEYCTGTQLGFPGTAGIFTGCLFGLVGLTGC